MTIPIILLIVAAGFFFGLTWRYISLSFDTSNQVNQIAGWITLLITITFCAFSSALGLVGEQGEGKPGTGAGALAFYGAFASIVVGSLFVAMGVEPIMAYTGVAAFAFPASGAFAFVLAVGIAVVGSFKESVALVFSFIFTILIACVVATSDTSTFTVAIGLAGVVMVGLTIFSCYFGHRAINGDLRDAWVRDRAVAFGAKFGTKFFGTVLTKADFTGAIIKNTDLRAESLIHTCFKDAIQLDLARVDTTLLAQPSVRELLVTLAGHNRDYSKANLRGANLNKANLSNALLKQADLSNANLIEANLMEANLTEANAVGTDFTRAIMTGATLESWNINTTTKLHEVKCKYVFRLEKPNKDGKTERVPVLGEFQEGDFESLFRQTLHTIEIILRGDKDINSFFAAFSMVRIGDGSEIKNIRSVKSLEPGVILVELGVPENANKEDIVKQIGEVREQAILQPSNVQHEKMMAGAGNILGSLLNPGTNITIYNTPMIPINPNTTNIRVDELYSSNSVVNLGDISGQVTNAINQLPSSSVTDSNQTEIKDLLIQLQNAIIQEESLDKEDQDQALEQVKMIAESAKSPHDPGMKKLVKASKNTLNGIITNLPETAKLAEATAKILPLILKVFGL